MKKNAKKSERTFTNFILILKFWCSNKILSILEIRAATEI